MLSFSSLPKDFFFFLQLLHMDSITIRTYISQIMPLKICTFDGAIMLLETRPSFRGLGEIGRNIPHFHASPAPKDGRVCKPTLWSKEKKAVLSRRRK